MSTTTREIEDKRYHSDRQANFQKIYDRAYNVGMDATLADMDLEEGDTLPGNSSAEIISARIEVDKKTAMRVAVVQAIEFVYET